jgi:hypothetical protein
MDVTYHTSVHQFRSAISEIGSECILTIIVGLKTIIHVIIIMCTLIRCITAAHAMVVSFAAACMTDMTQFVSAAANHMWQTCASFFVSVLLLHFVVLKDHNIPSALLYDPVTLILTLFIMRVEVLIYRHFMQTSSLLELDLLFCNTILLISIVAQCLTFPAQGDIIYFFEVPLGTCLLGYHAVTSASYSEPRKHLAAGVVRSSILPIILMLSRERRRGWIIDLYLICKLLIWGTNLFALAAYVSFEHSVLSTYHVCDPQELICLRMQNEVCPVCLEHFDAHSCRLDCGHTIHISCLVQIMQVTKSMLSACFAVTIVTSRVSLIFHLQTDSHRPCRCPICRSELLRLDGSVSFVDDDATDAVTTSTAQQQQERSNDGASSNIFTLDRQPTNAANLHTDNTEQLLPGRYVVVVPNRPRVTRMSVGTANLQRFIAAPSDVRLQRDPQSPRHNDHTDARQVRREETESNAIVRLLENEKTEERPLQTIASGISVGGEDWPRDSQDHISQVELAREANRGTKRAFEGASESKIRCGDNVEVAVSDEAAGQVNETTEEGTLHSATTTRRSSKRIRTLRRC